MAINIGPTLKRRRTWARLTQQELVDHTRMDRSASYISALESGKSSPTLVEMEQLSRYFSLTVMEFLQEAMDDSERRGTMAPGGDTAPEVDERFQRLYSAMEEADRDLTLEIMEAIAKRRKR